MNLIYSDFVILLWIGPLVSTSTTGSQSISSASRSLKPKLWPVQSIHLSGYKDFNMSSLLNNRIKRSISQIAQLAQAFDRNTPSDFSPHTEHEKSETLQRPRVVRRSQTRASVNPVKPKEIQENTRDLLPVQYHASLISPLSSPTSGDGEHQLRPEKCIPIEIPLCKNIGYNWTYMPNAFHHETQEEAGLEVHQFYPLVEINCSEDLRLFLCSMYTPICVPNWPYRLTPCRSLCESARDGCMPVMGTYGFGWPERMNCDLLPEGSECVSRRNSTVPSGQKIPSNRINPNEVDKSSRIHGKKTNTTISLVQDILTLLRDRYQSQGWKVGWDQNNDLEDLKQSMVQIMKSTEGRSEGQQVFCLPCRCRDPFVPAHKPPYNEVVTGGVTGCLPSCRNPAFNSKSDRTFTTFWLGLWAVLCILSTMATVATFLADPGRFQYPERPIIYLSACYLMVALGYLIRVGMGHESIACDGPMLRRGSTGPAQCSIVFLLTYVFGMASSVWWVILTLTWFLAAGLKWGSEAIAKYSQLYHFLAWFFPGAQAIFVLILSAIDGDPVGGLCYVGSTDLNFFRVFVLAPMCVYLTLGTIFLIAGFVALFKIRSAIKLQTRGHLKTDKLEKLMIRIGIFGVLYTVPATVVIGCICYELISREAWNRNHNCPCYPLPPVDGSWKDGELFMQKLRLLMETSTNSKENTQLDKSSSINTMGHPTSPTFSTTKQPEHAVFMLKYFMSLVVGITSGFWIWSSKTLDSWKFCLRRTVNRSCTAKNKRSLSGTIPSALANIGNIVPNKAPPQNWNPAHGKIWMGNVMKPMGINNSAVGTNSCSTWQDDFGPTARLLPQPPQVVSMSCNHPIGLHLGFNGMVPGSGGSLSVPGQATSVMTGLQTNSGSYAGGPMDGTGMNSGNASGMTAHTNSEANNNLLMMTTTQMTHM
ncbi:hypothetical protein CRM22_006114 [Opisthorchis felineus]|uniref:Uncharacterized protein n=1 Tax=Opisthorchis felineus TaxID=147828 RepID=A0A4S2LMQ3_OPIFE|nr:hypothetical protein CRM22_006114 [Opisthorchis felineus]